MKKTPLPPLPVTPEDSASDALLLDRAAADRALDFYLPNTAALQFSASAITTIQDSANLQTALSRASDLLRGAGALANEAGHDLNGMQRDLVLSVMDMLEMAKRYVDTSLDGLTASWELTPRQAN